MTFREYIEQKREIIKKNTALYMELKRNENLARSFQEQELIQRLEEFALRGKLIRGTLFVFMCEALGVPVTKSIINIACAIELMHSSLLIQDDIIDRDRIRRGAKTIFSLYEEKGEKIGAIDPYHYGISTAIIIADLAFFYAIDLITEFDSQDLRKLMKHYAYEVYLVAFAESVDSYFGQTNKEPTREDIYMVYKYKTARYTFSLPFEMAAIIANSDNKTRENLRLLGERAGIIFQLRDDQIGLFGDEKETGKPAGSDIRENKKTMIRYFLYKKATEEDKNILDRCFGNPKAGKNESVEVVNLYKKYKVNEMINKEISDIMKRVWIHFDKLSIKPGHKKILRELLEFNLRRVS